MALGRGELTCRHAIHNDDKDDDNDDDDDGVDDGDDDGDDDNGDDNDDGNDHYFCGSPLGCGSSSNGYGDSCVVVGCGCG